MARQKQPAKKKAAAARPKARPASNGKRGNGAAKSGSGPAAGIAKNEPEAGTVRSFVLQGETPVSGYDPWTVRVQEELNGLRGNPLQRLELASATVEARVSDHSLWLVGRWDGGLVGLRAAFVPGGGMKVVSHEKDKEELRFELDTAIGVFRVTVRVPQADIDMIRVTTTFTPLFNMKFPHWPRDVYPLDEAGNPLATRGLIHAAQRGSAAGVLYITITRPLQGTLFYFQNLTWLNGFAQTTETELNTVVGGEWPELGYKPPGSYEYAMTAGEEEEWSDFFVRFCEANPKDEGHRAQLFINSLADVYRHIPPPDTAYWDWPKQAEETLKALESPKCWVREMDHDFLHPYVCAEYPDSMAQLVLIPPLHDYAKWAGRDLPLIKKLRKGVPLFYDEHVKTVRRYLPTVGSDKNPNEVDSWYLYHPLTNLARLAQRGDEGAKELLQKAIGFAIKVARHFNYKWPIKLDLLTLEPTQSERKPGEPGQSDVPGLYAYLMLQARDVLGESWYVEEARRALQQLEGLGFSIGYQFNNAAWAMMACARMWKETREKFYQDMRDAFIASLFHNTILWEPDYGLTRNYSMFMGLTCLHDGNYTAMYEEAETFWAFEELLELDGDALFPALGMLLAEYRKFLLSRGRYYYPGNLPEEVLAKEIRNGEIDRELSIPLEDLYPERNPAGAVGQEIYGAHGAFLLTLYAYHRIPGAPFMVYCEYPLADKKAERPGEFACRVRGYENMTCRLRLIPLEDGMPRAMKLHLGGKKGDELPLNPVDGHLEAIVVGGSELTLTWKTTS